MYIYIWFIYDVAVQVLVDVVCTPQAPGKDEDTVHICVYIYTHICMYVCLCVYDVVVTVPVDVERP